MRIRNIRVNHWRHFENVEVDLGLDANLVCLVGANGTGKSHLLELIAACAHRLGLSHGVELPRGNVFDDPHDISLLFYLATGVSDAVEQGLVNEPGLVEWDRGIRIESRRGPQGHSIALEATGLRDQQMSRSFANRVHQILRSSRDVHFLSLDADRSYPRKAYNINEVAQAYEIDWAGEEYTRGRSFKTTNTLYDEWTKYFLAQENQSGTHLIRDIRRARQAQRDEPRFEDHFLAYKTALQKVLPHVAFAGVDSRARTLLFDTTGLELSFNQLSGGEREIAFLVGQIDRFRLRRGIFLLDEPELHLNADLVRAWVGYLTGTIETGQVWLATHSLEAVEAAGQAATFVLERNETTRKVDRLARLDSRPVISALSRAVGTPAFSLSQLAFVFVEGEESVGERERFRNLVDLPQAIRFIEVGNCAEVVRRVTTIRELANEAGAQLRITGVVDRDFRSAHDAGDLANQHQIFVLPVHEVENFFLHPGTVDALLAQNGRPQTSVDLIRDAADARAGAWIFQWAMGTKQAKKLPDMPVPAKDRAKTLAWSTIDADPVGAIASVSNLTHFPTTDRSLFERLLEVGVKLFRRSRSGSDLWKLCEGKEVLAEIAHLVGFSGRTAMIQACFATWRRDAGLVSNELAALRRHLSLI
jgi:predicted ATPase